MLEKTKIGMRIAIGFLIVVALMGALGTYTVVQLKRLQADFSEVGRDATLAMTHIGTMRAAVQKQAVLIRDIASYEDLSIQKAAIKEMKEADAAYLAAAAELMKLVGNADGALQNLLKEAERQYAPLGPGLRKAIASVQDADYDAAKDNVYKELRPVQTGLNDTLEKAADALSKSAEQAVQQSGNTIKALVILFSVLTFAGAAIAAAVGWYLTRSIVRPLHRAVGIAQQIASGDLTAQITVTSHDETGQLMQALKDMNDSLARTIEQVRTGTDTIAAASVQIAAGNQDLSSRTEQQAGSLEETASSMEQLTTTVRQNADNAYQANGLVLSASEVAIKGGTVVSQVVDTMGSINESAKKIVDIISVIDGIAFQTNILALNAAVEAARAGEQGRGFAVVASEVRNLAQRSAAAAKEIKALINDSVEKVDAGAKLVDQAGATMQEIVSSVKRVTDIMGEITAASQEQSAGIKQVNEAVNRMDQVTQQNAALVEEAAAAASSMQQQASNLVQVVSVFKLEGAPAAPAAHTAPAAAGTPVPARIQNSAPPRVLRPAAGSVQRTQHTHKIPPGVGQEWEEF